MNTILNEKIYVFIILVSIHNICETQKKQHLVKQKLIFINNDNMAFSLVAIHNIC